MTYKFKRGDRVIVISEYEARLQADLYNAPYYEYDVEKLPVGKVGIVIDDCPPCPRVQFEANTYGLNLSSYRLQLYEGDNNMTIKDIKSGMIVKHRNEELELAINSCNEKITFIATNGSTSIGSYKDDMTNIYTDEYDIIAVYKPTENFGLETMFKFHCNEDTIIWKREDNSEKKKKLKDIINELSTKLKDAQESLAKL
jgi:hypothetical protein